MSADMRNVSCKLIVSFYVNRNAAFEPVQRIIGLNRDNKIQQRILLTITVEINNNKIINVFFSFFLCL